MKWKNNLVGMTFMVGLLCSQGKERLFQDFLSSNAILKSSGISVIIFSMQNVNLNEKTVYGIYVSEGNIKASKMQLPSLIYNLGVQYKKSHIKKLKNLAEADNVILLNPVNIFNQWSIMKILASNISTKKFIFPYIELSNEKLPDFNKFGNFIIKPQNGSDTEKVIYCKKAAWGFDLYNIGEIMQSHLFDIQSAITPLIKEGNWLLLVSPELQTFKESLMIVRSYLQKDIDGEWKIVSKVIASQADQTFEKAAKETDAALLQMMQYINCFISGLNLCTIDFVLNNDGTPYFLSLSGWQDMLSRKNQRDLLLDNLCQSMKEYASKY